jgi:signal peptidase I
MRAPDNATPARNESFLSQVGDFFRDLLPVVVVSLGIIIPVRYFLIQPFYVKGASMEPSFHDDEYLIIDELSYRLKEPQRGDIVVFKYPNDPREYFIKRVIGLPGERIVIKDGRVTIYQPGQAEGTTLDETVYLGNTFTSQTRDVTLSADEFYLLGDNRQASLDSRIFGPVHRSFLVGRVWVRGWPPERAQVFSYDTPLAP